MDSGTSPDQDYWHLMIMAEIHFGLEQWTEAQTYLHKVLALWKAQEEAGAERTRDWQKETSFSQFANIAKLRHYPLPQKYTNIATWHEPACPVDATIHKGWYLTSSFERPRGWDLWPRHFQGHGKKASRSKWRGVC